MLPDVSRDLSKSASVFKNVVWPKVCLMLGGGDLVQVESVSATGFARDLDMLAGIDAWHVRRSTGEIFGIASRAQPAPYPSVPYQTFTIRLSRTSGAPTEYAKRLSAISSGATYPHWTIHGYYDGEKLISAAVVSTSALFQLARECNEMGLHQESQLDRASNITPRGWGIGKTTNASFLWLSFPFVMKNVPQEQAKVLTSSFLHDRKDAFFCKAAERFFRHG